jgi:hypothetical protein
MPKVPKINVFCPFKINRPSQKFSTTKITNYKHQITNKSQIPILNVQNV